MLCIRDQWEPLVSWPLHVPGLSRFQHRGIMEVPKFQKYRFAVVNKHRVIVDAKTRKIVKVYK